MGMKSLIAIAASIFFVTAPPSQAVVHHPPHRRAKALKTLSVAGLTLVDQNGTPKIRMSARSSQPVLQMLGPDGRLAVAIELDATGLPSITLNNPGGGSSASLAVDNKGAHVKFDHPSGASGYLFLNDEGVSGIVLLDKAGRRRYEVLLNSDGSVTTGRVGDDGTLIP